MIRKIIGVIAAYSIFVITSILLFKVSGQRPHAPAPITFMALTGLYGIVFSFVSGVVLQRIAKAQSLAVNYVLAFIIAAVAILSMATSVGSYWTQLLSIILFAPTSILGGIFFRRRFSKET